MLMVGADSDPTWAIVKAWSVLGTGRADSNVNASALHAYKFRCLCTSMYILSIYVCLHWSLQLARQSKFRKRLWKMCTLWGRAVACYINYIATIWPGLHIRAQTGTEHKAIFCYDRALVTTPGHCASRCTDTKRCLRHKMFVHLLEV